MKANFLDDRGYLRRRRAGAFRTGFARDARPGCLRCRLWQLHGSHNRLRIRFRSFSPGDSARANRRLKKTVATILHRMNSIWKRIIYNDAAAALSVICRQSGAQQIPKNPNQRPSPENRYLDSKNFALLTLPPQGGPP